MNKIFISGLCAIVLISVLPVHADDSKPLESPLHMTTLPVPDEFHGNQPQERPQNSNTRVYTYNTPNALNSPVSVEYRGIWDDTDAGLNGEGRR